MLEHLWPYVVVALIVGGVILAIIAKPGSDPDDWGDAG